MNETNGGRWVLGGAAVLMACACATSVHAARAISHTGMAATTTIVHPIFIGAGAGLVLYGLLRRGTGLAALGLAGFLVLAAAAALTPPRVMTASAIPWNGTQIGGAFLYLLAAALLGYVVWRAFPSRRPDASAMAVGGAVLATGCSCCMFTGAMSGLIGTAGWESGFVHPGTALFWTGMTLVAAGLWRMAGWRAAMWVPVGVVVLRYLPQALRATGDWTVADVATRTFAGWGVAVLGTAIVLYGFVVAWSSARAPAVEPEPRPALGTA